MSVVDVDEDGASLPTLSLEHLPVEVSDRIFDYLSDYEIFLVVGKESNRG